MTYDFANWVGCLIYKQVYACVICVCLFCLLLQKKYRAALLGVKILFLE